MILSSECSTMSKIVVILLVLLVYCKAIDPDEACLSFPHNLNPETVSSKESPIGERSWVALVWITCEYTQTCEGSLISQDWIMTAAACLPCGASASVIVDVGLHHSDIRREILQGRAVERVGVDGVFVHPSFDPSEGRNDIALLHLAKKVNSSFVIPMIECAQKLLLHPGRNCLSSGWGDTRHYSILDAKPMHDVYMGLWSIESCNVATNGQVDGTLCAGAKIYSTLNTSTLNTMLTNIPDPTSSNSCYVQRGGSLVISQPKIVTGTNYQLEIVCEWQLCGVLSQGMHCGQTNSPAIYTDPCVHQDWMTETIRQTEERILNLEGCPTLPSPPVNGYLCGLEGVSNGRVQFCCERGYKLIGPFTSSCDRKEKQWLPAAGICQPTTCPKLPTPLHASTNPSDCRGSSYTTGCWFSCEKGYHLKGNDLLTCQEDGTWSNVVPNCEAMDCGPPPVGGNLIVDYTQTTYTATATYMCKTCYQLINSYNSSLQRVCDANGEWNGPLPVCELVRCPPLVSPLYGELIQGTDTCGSQVRYECMDGFVLIGMDTATCMSTGEWSYPTPFCVSADCPHPVVENSINFAPPTPDNPPPYSYSYGDKITIKCENCRKPVGGSSNLTCLQGGKWDGVPPICEWVTCPLPKLIPNGQIFPLGNLYFCGTRVRFRCYPGYQLVGMSSTFCGQDGKWTYTFPTCEPLLPGKDCSDFSVTNGEVTITHTAVGGVANVLCDHCYKLNSHRSGILRCMTGGIWNNPIPTCARIYCPELSPLLNGYLIKQKDRSNSCDNVVLFECDNGYRLNGHLSTTCSVNGAWSHQPPLCEAILCPPPPEPKENSHICVVTPPGSRPIVLDPILSGSGYEDGSGIGSLTHSLSVLEERALPGTRVQYCCDTGSMSKQNGLLECTLSGQWNQDVPHCKNSYCTIGLIPMHLVILNISKLSAEEYPIGSVLYLTCESGYTLYGTDTITCIENNTWSELLPQCINSKCYQTCSSPKIPENGRIVSISNNYHSLVGGVSTGTIVVYLCHIGFHLHGSISRRCLLNGIWSGQETICLKFPNPSSKLILRHPDTKEWESVSSWHFTTSQQVYLACQTYTGIVKPIIKIDGPDLENAHVRVRQFGDADKSQQLILQATNTEGARTIEGTYLCQVTKNIGGRVMINRTIDIYMHEKFCPNPLPVANGNVIISGHTPGSCYYVNCKEGYRIINENSFRICLGSGEWSGSESLCVAQ